MIFLIIKLSSQIHFWGSEVLMLLLLSFFDKLIYFYWRFKDWNHWLYCAQKWLSWTSMEYIMIKHSRKNQTVASKSSQNSPIWFLSASAHVWHIKSQVMTQKVQRLVLKEVYSRQTEEYVMDRILKTLSQALTQPPNCRTILFFLPKNALEWQTLNFGFPHVMTESLATVHPCTSKLLFISESHRGMVRKWKRHTLWAPCTELLTQLFSYLLFGIPNMSTISFPMIMPARQTLSACLVMAGFW